MRLLQLSTIGFYVGFALSSRVSGAGCKSNGVGALYFVSNHPTGNFVITHSILNNGSVVFAGVTSTQGKGLRGQQLPGVPLLPDAMYSQGSVLVSGNHLFTVNTGSNTIVMFNIDPTDPTKLTMVGKPVSSGGEFPNSLDVNPRNGNVCVVNGGARSFVQCYTVSSTKGLTPIHNSLRPTGLNQTTPPMGPAGSLSQVLFTEDGSHVLAIVKGIPFPNITRAGFIQTWAVDPLTGSLSEKPVTSSVAEGGSIIYGSTRIAGTRAFLVTDAFIGYGVYDFTHGYNAPAVGTSYNLTGQLASCWVVYSKVTKSYYISDERAPAIYEVSLDKNLQGSTVAEHKSESGLLIDIAIGSIRSNDYLYVLNAGDLTVDIYGLPSRGKTNLIQRFSFAQPAESAGAVINGTYTQGMATYIH